MANYWKWYYIIAFICFLNVLLLYLSIFHNEQQNNMFLTKVPQINIPPPFYEIRNQKLQVQPPPNVLAGMQPKDLGSIKEPIALVKKAEPEPKEVLPIVVMACNRVGVKQCLDQLLQYRPSRKKFPIIVSQDCGHQPTQKIIQSFGSSIIYVRQPNLTNIALPRKFKNQIGYYKISRHYKFALDHVFMELNYSQAIIVEDDLNIAPDFFEYFSGTLSILQNDPSLYCVSAWNDNGKPELIRNDPRLLHRTDFFPGLGWMLLKSFWLELRDEWPKAFWDDFLREPKVRKGRACIRPEISRTTTFGQKGVSNGLFYNIFLRFIKLNSDFVPFTQMDLTYLYKTVYDKAWLLEINSVKPVSIDSLTVMSTRPDSNPIALIYSTKQQYLSITKTIGAMTDFKSGVPRTGYLGAVLVMYHNHKVYILPPPGWKDYNTKW